MSWRRNNAVDVVSSTNGSVTNGVQLRRSELRRHYNAISIASHIRTTPSWRVHNIIHSSSSNHHLILHIASSSNTIVIVTWMVAHVVPLSHIGV